MLKKFVQFFGGDPNKRKIEKLSVVAEEINALEPTVSSLTDDALSLKTIEFRRRLAMGETLDDIMREAFAAAREASKRTLGLRHYDVQLICGIAMHEGVVAEMRTGEGKTLVATLPIYLNALPINEKWQALAVEHWGEDPNAWKFEPIDGVPVGCGVHLVTVNDYLARRDARWMAPVYQTLGLSVGVLQMAARTDYGKKAFLVDLTKESPHEDQNHLVSVHRKLAYNADITYGTTNEYGFDYLRDNMAMRLEDRVQRSKETGGHHFAVIDEVDNVLIDEARTPLIISGPSTESSSAYEQMAQIIRQLRPEDYEVDEKARSATLTEIGEIHVEDIVGEPLRDPERPEDITPEQAQRLGYLEQAMRAQFIYKRNKDYLVQGRKVIIIDESTGRLMPGRRWSDGLHQAVEAKEGVPVQSENVTYATVTIQNYYRKYQKLSGMTGTAATEAEEFFKIYKLNVSEIPPNLEYRALRPNSDLVILQGRDKENYEFTYYARKEDPQKKPVLFKRKDYPDVVYRTEEAKFRAITREIMEFNALGRPMLVGTTSVELSDTLSNRLKAEPIRKFAQVLVLRDAWFTKNKIEEDGRAVTELDFLNRPFGLIPPKEMRDMANELGVPLSPVHPDHIEMLRKVLHLPTPATDRLEAILKNGIDHQVLNARKHTEESKIIEYAGAFGAVTIATNMAGRGVDIVLGGTMDDEILQRVTRVARNTYERAGMTAERDELAEILRKGASGGYGRSSHYERLKTWRQHFPNLPKDETGIYESDVLAFDQFISDHHRVLELGGLHVIGSERHEARRIDNQLRGRSARQGDPGSSRFYLSMQDNLMRLFGGAQAEGLMGRLRIDDSMPIELGLVTRIVESSQSRVEGANFDTRKHLLEYDDVLNAQRETIYGQRDRIFTKDDLTADVTEMLETEIAQRVPVNARQAADQDQYWRLVAWLGQIQPNLAFGTELYPSFMYRKLVSYLRTQGVDSQESLRDQLVYVSEQAILTEKDHVLKSMADLVERTEESLERQLEERLDNLDVYLEGFSLGGNAPEEVEGAEPEAPRASNARELQDELTSLLRLPVKVSNDEFRQIQRDSSTVANLSASLRSQVSSQLAEQSLRRVTGFMERLLGQELPLDNFQLTSKNWGEFESLLEDKITAAYQKRVDTLLNPDTGHILRDVDAALKQITPPFNDATLAQLLINITRGAKAVFDQRTKKQTWKETSRMTYLHFVASLVAQMPPKEIEKELMEHLQTANANMQRGWGNLELNRIAALPMSALAMKAQAGLEQAVSPDIYAQVKDLPLARVEPAHLLKIRDELGRQLVTEIYRQMLLGVITEQWVDYLTQIEALRVSIGLEAYAQRDPLVQYKSRASTMFQELMKNIRISAVNRMFTYRPRDLSTIQTATLITETKPVTEEETAGEDQDTEYEGDEEQIEPRQRETPAQGESVSARRRRRRKK